jgi:hypothetical protein
MEFDESLPYTQEPLSVYILSQMNPVYTVIFFFTVHFNINLRLPLGLPSYLFV